MIVEVEIAAKLRDPLKLPAHGPLEGFDLAYWSARNHHQRRVAIGEVHGGAVKMIRPERTAWAALFPPRTQHEVIHEELPAAAEKIGQRYLSPCRIECIWLLYLFPGQSAALAA